MSATKPRIFKWNGEWHVIGGDWRMHALACDFAAYLNGSNDWTGR